MLLNCGVGEGSWESLGLQGGQTSPSWRKSVLNIYWKDWCWSWSSNTLATWCEELTHWKRPWCWERLKAGEGTTGWDVGWHHQLDGHESEQALGAGNAQGSLVCCSPWGCKELDTTWQLNNKVLWGPVRLVMAILLLWIISFISLALYSLQGMFTSITVYDFQSIH